MVYQRDWVWYVRNSDTDEKMEFYNGSFLDWKGRMHSTENQFGQDEIDKLYHDWHNEYPPAMTLHGYHNTPRWIETEGAE